MKKQLKGFVIGVLVTLILTSTIAFAGGAKQKIEVMFNSINLTVNGKPVKADNILYKGTTYVPLRAVGEMLGKEVGWNQKTNTASINDKGFKEPVKSTKPTDTSKSNDFRNVKWGMSVNEVKNNEDAESIFESKDMLVYRTSFLNKNTDIIYKFNNNGKLYNIACIVKDKHTNKNLYVDEYNDLKDELISIYGKPSQQDVFWYNDLYKDNYENWGLAVSIGDVEFYSVWDLLDTKVILRLMKRDNSSNNDILLGILYQSKNTKPTDTSSNTTIDNKKEDRTNINNITNSYELQQYLQNNFGTLDTIIGTTNFKFKISENENIFFPEDYWIKVEYEYDYFEGAMSSTKYTNEQKQTLRKQLRSHMKNIGEASIDAIPNKKIRGGYHASWYRYPNLQVDLITRDYYSWKNYGDFDILSEVSPYEQTKPSNFMWDEELDDEL